MGEATPMTILQAETRVLVGGSDGEIHQYKNNGLSISTVATSSSMVYSLTVRSCFYTSNIHFQESAAGQLYCGGNTATIDVYKSYGYRTHQVQT